MTMDDVHGSYMDEASLESGRPGSDLQLEWDDRDVEALARTLTDPRQAKEFDWDDDALFPEWDEAEAQTLARELARSGVLID